MLSMLSAAIASSSLLFDQIIKGTASGNTAAAMVQFFVVSAGLFAAGFFLSQQQSLIISGGKKKAIPYAPTTLFEVLSNLTGPDAPWFLLELARKCQRSTYRLPIPLPSGVFVIGDHKLAREILLDPLTEKPMSVYQPSQVLSGGIPVVFSSPTDSDYWKFARKCIRMAFSNTEIARMKAVCVRHVDHFIHHTLEEYAQNDIAFDPAHEMINITLHSIMETAFEYKFSTQQEADNLLDYIECGLQEYRNRLMNPIRKPLKRFIATSMEAEAKCQLLQDFVLHNVLENYRNKPDDQKSPNSTIIKLIHDCPQFRNDKERVAEMISSIVAGFDTTAYTLSNTLVLLAKYPQYQDKLRQELLAAASSPQGEDGGKQVPYLDYVFKESFRVLPVGAMFPMRQSGREFVTANGESIPKGATCFMPQLVSNYNPDTYCCCSPSSEADDTDTDTASLFVPDRWANPTPAMKEALIPFALGSRGCPGQSLAKAELNATLPALVSNFRFELVDEGKPVYFLTMKMSGSALRAHKIL